MTNNNPILEAALHYAELGWSVIPVCKPIDAENCVHHGKCRSSGKAPIGKWAQYQKEKASKEQIQKWWEQYPDANVGIITGKISGIVVVDVEAGGDIKNLPLTVISRTGGGGWHYLYRCPDKLIRNAVRVHKLTDVRGEGGLIVMPPSLHKSGNNYEWAVSPDMEDFAPLPQWVLDEALGVKQERTDWQTFVEQVNPEGSRNDRTTQYVGLLLNNFHTKFWNTVAWRALLDYNATHNQPPLSEQEAKSIWQSITKAELQRRDAIERDDEELSILPLSQLMQKEFADVPWIADNFIPHEAITVISGAPAAYKTWLVLDIALKVASNGILFDKFPTTQSSVLIVDEENGERLLQGRIKMLCNNFGVPVFFLSLKNFRLNGKAVKKITSLAKQYGIRVVIFDSLIRIHGEDENDATKMASVFKNLKELSKSGLAVILTHHNRKQGMIRSNNPSQEMRGSSDILASVDCHIGVEKKAKEGFITVTQTKLRQAKEMKPFNLNIINDSDSLRFEYAGEVDEVLTKREECKVAIKALLEEKEEPLSKKELFDSLKATGFATGYSTFKSAAKEMVERGELYEKKGSKNMTLCSIKPFDSDDG